MAVARMQQHFAFTRAHEVVLLIGDVHAVAVHFVQAVLIRKTVQAENIARIYRLDCSRMQVRVIFRGLHYSRSERLNGRLVFLLLFYRDASLGYGVPGWFRSRGLCL